MRKPNIVDAAILCAVVAVIASALAFQAISGMMTMKEKPNVPELWVEVHDVSPLYLNELKEVVSAINAGSGAYGKAILLVIPNHNYKAALDSDPAFQLRLSGLAKSGFIIGMHGYSHSTPDTEFNSTLENAMKYNESGLKMFSAAGLPRPRYFAPPRYAMDSAEAGGYIESQYDYVFYENFTVRGTEKLDYPAHEYTWHRINSTLETARALREYRATSEPVFRLSVHLGAVNTVEGMDFLRGFLSGVSAERAAALGADSENKAWFW